MNLGDVITQDQADQFLQDDVAAVVAGVNKSLTVEVTQNQFDALCDFAYNLGVGDERTSTLVKLINQGDIADAANQFPLWCHAGGVVVQDLVNRRAQEQALFLTDD
jgi:lysozyme